MFAPTLEVNEEIYTTQPAPTETSQRGDNWLITVRELVYHSGCIHFHTLKDVYRK